MGGWRENISVIARILTGQPPRDWRHALILISGTSANRRKMIEVWAEGFGVYGGNWRDNICGISEMLVVITPMNWREALYYIRLYYEGNPPTPYALYDNGTNRIFDNANNALYVRWL